MLGCFLEATSWGVYQFFSINMVLDRVVEMVVGGVGRGSER